MPTSLLDGPGRVLRLVRLADRVTMPWKNGGGVTHELWREPAPGGEGFDLRLSVAEVAQDGPFSRFPGVDRVIVLLSGAGFDLVRADGAAASIRTPGEAYAFHGEDDWRCTLPGGPVLDFNVMVRRAAGRVSAHRAGPGRVYGRFVLALEPGTVGAEPLAAGELAEIDGEVAVGMPVVVVNVWALPAAG